MEVGFRICAQKFDGETACRRSSEYRKVDNWVELDGYCGGYDMSGTCLVSVISKGVTVMRKINWNVQQTLCIL